MVLTEEKIDKMGAAGLSANKVANSEAQLDTSKLIIISKKQIYETWIRFYGSEVTFYIE